MSQQQAVSCAIDAHSSASRHCSYQAWEQVANKLSKINNVQTPAQTEVVDVTDLQLFKGHLNKKHHTCGLLRRLVLLQVK